MSKLGEAIKAEREAAGLSIPDLARQAKILAWTLDAVERGDWVPPHEVMLSIANQLPDADSVAWAWLLAEDLFGASTVKLMRRHAVAAREGQSG